MHRSRYSFFIVSISMIMLVFLSSCESNKTSANDTVKAEPVVPAKLTAEQILNQASAKHWIARARQQSFDKAMLHTKNQLMRQERETRPSIPTELLENADHLVIIFSANNHGEREDCGCKRNPMGGLTRRATMIDLARQTRDNTSDDDLKALNKYWGFEHDASFSPFADAVFVADAGDLLFPHSTVRSSPQDNQHKLKQQAEAIVMALNERAPDVFNIGELDLSMGLGTLEELAKKATFPFISANLKRASDDSFPFKGHVVVERHGQKIAFIGLTKSRARVSDFHKQQGVKVAEPFVSYQREIANVPQDVDMVVLLNNNGMEETEALVKKLKAAKLRVDAAIVSNSNRMTADPRWTGGVPVVEPLSRGKKLGRMDLFLRGDGPPHYMNETASKMALFVEYRGAWQGYLNAVYMRDRNREKIAELKLKLYSKAPVPQSNTKDKASKSAPKKPINEAGIKNSLMQLKKKEELLESRVKLTSESALEFVAKIKDMESSSVSDQTRGSSDDWCDARVMPVLLEIPEEDRTRKILDKYKE